MTNKICLMLAVIAAATISIVHGQQTVKVTSSGIGYLEYLPEGYKSNNNKYPVVISLHGIKEKGTSSRDPNLVKAGVMRVANVGLPKYVKYGEKYPFILISPQLKNNLGSWPSGYIIEVLNHVKKHLRIDDRRVYLTGLSLGGMGVWKTAGEYPHVFAAIAPICPGGNAISKASALASQNIPAWGFHGGSDRVVSYTVTTRMVNAMNSAPKRPSPLAKATIFPGMNHVIWDRAYKNTNVLGWMLGFRKGTVNHDSGDDDDDDDDGDDDNENSSPVVSAGSNKMVTLPRNSVSIQGRASDKDGSIESYQWSKISGGQADLSATSSPRMRAYNLKAGSYVFRLTVKDNKGVYKSDDVTVKVVKSPSENENPGKNSLPIVSAGGDRVLTLPKNSVTLRGQASDKDGTIVSYQWVQTLGNKINANGTNTATMRLYNMKRGAYLFRLTAKDNKGGVSHDVVKVVVKN